MRVVGVDGCKEGWVAIVLLDGRFETALFAERLAALLDRQPSAAVVAVDIPIGSEPGRFRRVDASAKTFVGPRHRSVFVTPPIETFRQASYETACELCRGLTGNSPSKQAWELRTKILEVDAMVTPDDRLIEVHPEVSFRALLDRPLIYSKKTWAGHMTRRGALAGAGIVLPADIGEAAGAAPDDVLDAAVAAWSAHRHATRVSRHLDPKVGRPGEREITIWF